MVQGLFTVQEVIAMIEKGDSLLLAGDSALLKTLPKGKWIAGVTSRFIEAGKDLVTTREKIFVHNVTDIAASVKLKEYDASAISGIYDDAFDNGFSVLILPYSKVMFEYAFNCMNYTNFASRALCGWISVVPVYSEYERNDVSLVFSGETGLSYTESAVVMHIALPPDKYAEVHAFNPLVPEVGDVIHFEGNAQRVENVLVNGVRQNFRQYMIDRQLDRSSGNYNVLAGDYTGIIKNMNTNLAFITCKILPETEHDEGKYVTLGNPVYKNIPYRFAKIDPANSYSNMDRFEKDKIVFSLSCITNYVFPDIFLKYLTQANGPFAYGEIAYFVLNQSTVYVTIGSTSN